MDFLIKNLMVKSELQEATTRRVKTRLSSPWSVFATLTSSSRTEASDLVSLDF